MDQLLEPQPLASQSSRRHFQTAHRKTYTRAQICADLNISRRTFFDWKKAGKLPLVEVRIGRTVRYHAAPLDRLYEGRGRHGR